MSEGVTIAVEDAIRAWEATRAADEEARAALDAAGARERLPGLVVTLNRAADDLARAKWALIDRLVEGDPGARWRMGDRVYWTEDARLRSGPVVLYYHAGDAIRCLRSEPADPR